MNVYIYRLLFDLIGNNGRLQYLRVCLVYVICTCSLMPVGFLRFLSMNDFLPRCLFAVVIKCFTIGVNV